MALKTSITSISVGDDSIKILTHSQKIGIVVIMTNIENKKVQIGSANYHSGLTFMITAATMTPILYTMSPIIWITAALTFIFSFSSFSCTALEWQ